MLQRMLELPAETIAALRPLRACASSPRQRHARCPGELAAEVMDRFGDVLYNLYGSTEVAWATIATPAGPARRARDRRAARRAARS